MSVNNQQYNYQMPPQMPPQPPRQPIVNLPRQTKNKFLTFVFACFPGAGQMYHGLMKKGASIMLLFWGIVGIAAVTYLGVLTILLPVIWFYSFFDTVNRMNMPIEEMRALKDNFLLFGDSSDELSGKLNRSKTFERLFQERHLIIGWLLIFVAAWILVNNFFGGYLGYHFWTQFISERAYYVMRDFVELIPALIVPVFCIVIGVKLIKGDSGKKPLYDEYTVPRDAPSTNKPARPAEPVLKELFEADAPSSDEDEEDQTLE